MLEHASTADLTAAGGGATPGSQPAIAPSAVFAREPETKKKRVRFQEPAAVQEDQATGENQDQKIIDQALAKKKAKLAAPRTRLPGGTCYGATARAEL